MKLSLVISWARNTSNFLKKRLFMILKKKPKQELSFFKNRIKEKNS
jgi:hypothetical protein